MSTAYTFKVQFRCRTDLYECRDMTLAKRLQPGDWVIVQGDRAVDLGCVASSAIILTNDNDKCRDLMKLLKPRNVIVRLADRDEVDLLFRDRMKRCDLLLDKLKAIENGRAGGGINGSDAARLSSQIGAAQYHDCDMQFGDASGRHVVFIFFTSSCRHLALAQLTSFLFRLGPSFFVFLDIASFDARVVSANLARLDSRESNSSSVIHERRSRRLRNGSASVQQIFSPFCMIHHNSFDIERQALARTPVTLMEAPTSSSAHGDDDDEGDDDDNNNHSGSRSDRRRQGRGDRDHHEHRTDRRRRRRHDDEEEQHEGERRVPASSCPVCREIPAGTSAEEEFAMRFASPITMPPPLLVRDGKVVSAWKARTTTTVARERIAAAATMTTTTTSVRDAKQRELSYSDNDEEEARTGGFDDAYW